MAASVVWTPSAIDAECKAAQGSYVSELKRRYTDYFAERPEEAGTQAWSARDLHAALPPGFERLELLMPESARHGEHLSGGSSQVLALALLGAAYSVTPDLAWYGELLRLPLSERENPRVQFEHVLDAALLGERAHFPTTVDMLVSDAGIVACGEAKLWEQGLGRCGCHKRARRHAGPDASDPAESGGECSPDVQRRDSYWATARDVLGFRERLEGDACPIAAAYQGVRNTAAARELARGRTAAFVLFFDERNPYFSPTGAWPGWPAYLESCFLQGDRTVEFRHCSWQRLLASGAVPNSVVEWARVKHGLEPSSPPSAA